MMRPEVLRQTLYLQRRSIAIWAVSLALLVAMYAALWPSIRDQPALTAVLEDLPEVLRSLLAGADMSTPIGYVQTELLALTGPLLIILFAVAAGAGGIAGEEDRRRLELLLANPIRRTRVVLEKVGAMMVGTVVLVTAMGAALWLAGFLGGPQLPVGNLMAAMVHLALLGLVFGSAAAAVGAATGSLAASRAVPGVLAVLAYAVNGLAPLVSWLEPFRALSPFYQYSGHQPLVNGLSLPSVLVAALTVGVLTAAAMAAFRRRDVAG